MNSIINVVKKILVFVLIIFILFFVGYQIYSALYTPYQTEIILEDKHENTLEVEGVFLREEKYVSQNHDGFIVHYLLENGEKIEAGGSVAELYTSEQDIISYEKIKSLKEKINLLEESQQQSSELITNAEQITNQIVDKMKALSKATYNNDADAIKDCKDDLFVLFNRRNIITKKENDYNNAIKEINAEISKLQKGIKNAVKSVKVSTNGNFVTKTDGYETTAVYESISALSVDEIKSFIKTDNIKEVPQNTIGKLVTNFEWNYVYILPIDNNEYNEKIKEGTTLKMRFEDISENPYTVTVNKVILDNSSNQMAVFVTSDEMSDKLCLARKTKAEIVFSTIRGYKINKNAVKFEDGKKGVYVIIGQEMIFRNIDILYEDDKYVICNSKGSKIKPYDDVIVKGTDLYNGKSTRWFC